MPRRNSAVGFRKSRYASKKRPRQAERSGVKTMRSYESAFDLFE